MRLESERHCRTCPVGHARIHGLLEIGCGQLEGGVEERKADHSIHLKTLGCCIAGAMSVPFADLIRVFVEDQTVAPYQTYQDLFEYRRYSGQFRRPSGGLTAHLVRVATAALLAYYFFLTTFARM
jgi:hypothetical protein